MAETFQKACMNNVRNNLQNFFMINTAVVDDPSITEVFFEEKHKHNAGATHVNSHGMDLCQ